MPETECQFGVLLMRWSLTRCSYSKSPYPLRNNIFSNKMYLESMRPEVKWFPNEMGRMRFPISYGFCIYLSFLTKKPTIGKSQISQYPVSQPILLVIVG